MELNQIIQGDCLEVMRTFPDKSFDLVLTDPPYGIGADKGVGGFGSSDTAKKYEDTWDTRPTKSYFDEMLRVGKKVIIFGGNYFTDLLSVNGHWLVWDKKGSYQFDNPFSDCELAWTNVDKKVVKKYIVIQQGFIAAEKERYHPTQKPVQLFAQIIRDYTDEGGVILDPFLGSGTTAIAATQTGRKYVGVDISPKYCEVSRKRIETIQAVLI